MNIYDLLLSSLEVLSISDISKELFVSNGTIRRWLELKNVPKYYYFDLCRINNIKIDYSIFSEKDKDQFYTLEETAKYCIKKSYDILESLSINIDDYNIIEPAAGNGSFYKNLPKDKTIALDIEPKYDGIIEKNFLDWKPDHNKNICIGNPPFGLRGNLALRFINHASNFSDFICFILPQLFNSNGKGSCKKRIKNLSLIYNEKIRPDFYYPSGRNIKVNTVFQIWSKIHRSNEKKVDISKYVELYSLSNGGTPGTTRNKKYINLCDYYLPSTCFGSHNMRLYNDFYSLPQQRGYGIILKKERKQISKIIESIDWFESSFKSTNGALNLRFDIIEESIFNKINLGYKNIISPFFY